MSEGTTGKSVIKTLGDGTRVCCMELTVAQVRGLLQATPGNDLIDELLLEDVRLPDLPLFTGLKLVDLEQMLPSDLEVLVEGCKEANPSFFRMLAKVASPLKQA
ncbi:hypothetical protein [Ectopseudomonas alcaliphila]|uniref:Phage tail assembly chaperone protein, E, or 41 or 14 n=1 Tax=Ectopseudomonas alcaliphila TaxID=101564 RepID=A0A1G7MJW5_9GAMM|nr:hypothetical protein [Pseudomonas alcaliphila]MDX5994947.1 hypothetical protein [Pseudomonas alcaliphila]SDF61954.1 hypothetical protein SAMN05216575_10972 [Pseudomonas alcaliphila]